MSIAVVCKLDEMEKVGQSATDILHVLRAERAVAGEPGPSLSAVYRTMRGQSYKRGAPERRGRPAKLPPGLVGVAEEARLNLVQSANSEYMVTWGDVYKETRQLLKARGMLTKKVHMPCADWFMKTVRAKTNVRARHGKRRISHEKDYKARRLELAKKWARYPKSWWEHHIHAYTDNKTFVTPRTGDMKKSDSVPKG